MEPARRGASRWYRSARLSSDDARGGFLQSSKAYTYLSINHYPDDHIDKETDNPHPFRDNDVGTWRYKSTHGHDLTRRVGLVSALKTRGVNMAGPSANLDDWQDGPFPDATGAEAWTNGNLNAQKSALRRKVKCKLPVPH